jgi:hypothetical protein
VASSYFNYTSEISYGAECINKIINYTGCFSNGSALSSFIILNSTSGDIYIYSNNVLDSGTYMINITANLIGGSLSYATFRINVWYSCYSATIYPTSIASSYPYTVGNTLTIKFSAWSYSDNY